MIDHATGEKIERIGARQEAARLKALMDRHIDPREEKAERQAAHEARKLESQRPDNQREEPGRPPRETRPARGQESLAAEIVQALSEQAVVIPVRPPILRSSVPQVTQYDQTQANLFVHAQAFLQQVRLECMATAAPVVFRKAAPSKDD